MPLPKNAIQPWREKEWCIPTVDAEFVAKMEEVLSVYELPYDEKRPVVCMDEMKRQLIKETRLPAIPGETEKVDSVYERAGVTDVFLAVERKTHHDGYRDKNCNWICRFLATETRLPLLRETR
ncbi:hypothetical protein FACS1894200_06530 [Spirochaetia bacterium]|nr:hypothetical protein FACS1894200_06530 [Spirochaetia bacterium]